MPVRMSKIVLTELLISKIDKKTIFLKTDK